MTDAPAPAKSGKKSCCLIGCVGVALASVGLFVVFGAWMGQLSSRFAEAEELKAQRQELAKEQPFQPSADGRVRAERLDAFLRVRNRLRQPCSDLQGFFGAIDDLEAKEESGEEPGFMDGLGVATAGMQLPGMMADYFEMRNRALLDEQMTLDEWRWYSVLAYRSAGGAFVPEVQVTKHRISTGGSGDKELVRRTLVKQLESARAATEPAVDAAWLALLEAEVARLDEELAWPWAEGLPEPVAEALEPRAEDLRLAYCRESEPFELDEVRHDGMTIQID